MDAFFLQLLSWQEKEGFWNDLVDVDGGEIDFEFAGGEAGDVEEVFDQADFLGDAGADKTQGFAGASATMGSLSATATAMRIGLEWALEDRG